MNREGKIEIFTGALGSGKTAFAVELAMEHLLRGGTVITNVEMNRERLRDWLASEGREFDDGRLKFIEDSGEFYKEISVGAENMCVMALIDETHIEHNSRDWQKTTRELLLFNTMARKLYVHVVYITQNENNIDKQLRSLANIVWRCRNMSQLRVLGVVPFPFPVLVRVPHLYTPGMKPVHMAPQFSYKSKAFGFYKSDAIVGSAKALFSTLPQADISPLRRIPRKPLPMPLERKLLLEVLAYSLVFLVWIHFFP